jgi:hypothetical protein
MKRYRNILKRTINEIELFIKFLLVFKIKVKSYSVIVKCTKNSKFILKSDYLIKLVIIGNSSVGKSSLMLRFSDD